MLKLLLTLCQYDCVICISDVCDILSIDVYSLFFLQCFSYQVFRVNVEQIYTVTIIQPCRTPRFIAISSDVSFSYRTVAFCGRYRFVIMFISLSGTPAFDRISKSKSCLTLSNALV